VLRCTAAEQRITLALDRSNAEWNSARGITHESGKAAGTMRAKQNPPKSLGELIAQRRQELGLRQVELALRIKGRRGIPVSQEQIANLESNRRPPPGLPVLKQLPRALKLEPEVVYFWGGRIPPDIRPSGLSEAAVQEAWAAFRATLARARGRPEKTTSRARRRTRQPGDEQALRGWQGRRTLGGLIAWRQRQLGLVPRTLAARITGQSGKPVSKQRISDIEQDRFGVPRRPLLRQLARELKLDLDVLYLWAGRLPPDIRPTGLSETAIREAWAAFRSVATRARRRHPAEG
jgi:transcriptional regulator with XRE-family HTH domain